MAEYIEREKAKRLLHIEYAYAAEQTVIKSNYWPNCGSKMDGAE